MEYRILGPLEVRDGVRSISLGTAKQQTLLAVLGEDGQRRNLFYSPGARVFAAIGISLDAFYDRS